MTINLKADTTGKYGEYGVLPALYDVEAAFTSASGSRKKRHDFEFDPKSFSINGDRPDTFHVEDHIQSVARLAGEGEENILVFTRSARDAGDAGLYVVPFNGIKSDGDAWKWASSRTSDKANDFLYYRFPRANHAGGVQTLGSMVFVANEDDSNDAYIQILDLRNPFDLNKNDRYISQLVIDGKNGEPTNSNGELINDAGEVIKSKASAVAATRLEDGRYLLFVGGRGSGKYGWFYVSDSPEINNETTWNFLDFWDKSDISDKDNWQEWENINFISDAKNGDIYMLAMGTSTNKSFLYRLIQTGIKLDGKPDLSFELVKGRGLNVSGFTSQLGFGISTRWGAGIHVTPNRNLISYVTDRQPDIKIDEFRYHGNGMNGTDADDRIFGTKENDTIYGGYGDDNLDGKEGNDYIYGGYDNDLLFGGDGADFIYGGEDNDTLWGWFGDDTLDGRSGDDEVFGEAGNDLLFGGEGNDLVNGGDHNDTLWGWFGDDTLDGWLGNDEVFGEAGNDLLFGGEGNDLVNGGEDNDTLWGWFGNDTLDGWSGNDEVFGEAGNDLLFGGEGNDLVNGGDHNDTLWGWFGDDTLDGELGNDEIFGEAGNDTLYGREGKDRLEGGDGNDFLMGGSEKDVIQGNAGHDIILGGTGNDFLQGDAGDDVLTGGLGADAFTFQSPNVGVDVITDFNADEGDFIRIGLNFGATSAEQFSYDAKSGLLSFDASATDDIEAKVLAVLENPVGFSLDVVRIPG